MSLSGSGRFDLRVRPEHPREWRADDRGGLSQQTARESMKLGYQRSQDGHPRTGPAPSQSPHPGFVAWARASSAVTERGLAWPQRGERGEGQSSVDSAGITEVATPGRRGPKTFLNLSRRSTIHCR